MLLAQALRSPQFVILLLVNFFDGVPVEGDQSAIGE